MKRNAGIASIILGVTLLTACSASPSKPARTLSITGSRTLDVGRVLHGKATGYKYVGISTSNIVWQCVKVSSSGTWKLTDTASHAQKYGYVFATNTKSAVGDNLSGINPPKTSKVKYSQNNVVSEKNRIQNDNKQNESDTDEVSSSVTSSSSVASSSTSSTKSSSKNSDLLAYFQKSLDARVTNDSGKLISAKATKQNADYYTVKYIGDQHLDALGQTELQAYADELFDSTQKIAAMCGLKYKVGINLWKSDGSTIIARRNANGGVTVYPVAK